MDRIVGHEAARMHLLLPAGRIIVDPDQLRAAGAQARMVEEREISKAELADDVFQDGPKRRVRAAAAGFLLELIDQAGVRQRRTCPLGQSRSRSRWIYFD